MFICNECGKIVERLPMGKQCHGHTSLGFAIEEKVVEPCSCGGEFVEATECKVCGNHFDNSNLFGVCESCLEEHETVGEALKIGNINHEDVAINGFIAKVLSADQINYILRRWVEENFVDHSRDVVRYCESDKSYFSEWIEDKYGN